MKLLTCTGCKFSGECARARNMKDVLRGLGIFSLKFRCPQREDVFSPGQAAIFTTYISDSNDTGESTARNVHYQGRVIQQYGGKVVGFIAPSTPDESGDYPFEARCSGYVKMPLARVKPDDTRPAISLSCCRFCGSHFDLTGVCRGEPDYLPLVSMCLAKAHEGISDAR